MHTCSRCAGFLRPGADAESSHEIDLGLEVSATGVIKANAEEL